MKKIYTLFLFLFFASAAYAQYGELSGKVIDEKGDPIPFATVALKQSGVVQTGAKTDFNGQYVIKLINPGTYDMTVSELTHSTAELHNINIQSEKSTTQNVTLVLGSHKITEVIVSGARTGDNTITGTVHTAAEIEKTTSLYINDIIAQSGSVFQRDNGSGLNINGSRSYNVVTYIDGVKVVGDNNVPPGSIQEAELFTGGIPAKYGDATGGVINITTKSSAPKLTGGITAQSSEYPVKLDPYGSNIGSFNLSGPLVSKKDSTGKKSKVLGFFLSGSFDGTRSPSAGFPGTYVVKPSVMSSINQNPFTVDPLGTGLTYRGNYLTSDSFNHLKAYQNAGGGTGRINVKFDFHLPNNELLTIGGNGLYSQSRNGGTSSQLLDPENNSESISDQYTVLARFTQSFNNSARNSLLQSANYSIQADYTSIYGLTQDANFKKNFFDYGYIGKFNTQYTPVYQTGLDSVTGITGPHLVGYSSTGVTTDFSNSSNPILANYTKQYYSYYANDPAATASLTSIVAGRGLINGQEPPSIYQLYSNPGTDYNNYNVSTQRQYHLTFNGNLDLVKPNRSEADKKKDRGRHSIEFGFEYEQRNLSHYVVAPTGLWGLMRQLANAQLTELNTGNPLTTSGNPVATSHFVAGHDTITYNRLYVHQNQSYFDSSLRKVLGMATNSTNIINTDALNPSTYSLSMFSPDELFNNGSPYMFYYGYNYLGQPITGRQPTFDDFFTAKNSSGMLTRPMAAYRPIYTAGYIQDAFKFDDIQFNVGVRLDRFDANQSILIDQYSLYPTYTANQLAGTPLAGVTIPSDVPGNAVVYTDDPLKPTKILGFRVGDNWYNAEGTSISNPNQVANPSTGTVTPYVKSTSTGALPALSGTSFTQYTPQISAMPRLSFSFPITDESDFFAHYDVYVQHPAAGAGTLTGYTNVGSPFEYYYLNNITTDYIIANPALKPEKTIDYQVGFQQELSRNSTISISALYRDMLDEIQVSRVIYSYPIAYNTYGNTDFGTVKSMLLSYNMAPVNNVSFNANYTLSFAEGTGSSVSSFLSTLSANPDVVTPKPVLPLNYDQRHTITATIDYHYGKGDKYTGPKGKIWEKILQELGGNLTFNGSTGTPYTQISSANSIIDSRSRLILGDINGSRLPFDYRFNLRVDKNFSFMVNEKHKVGVQVYLIVYNLFNTKNILSVYPYTGSPSDDGYLNSAQGQQYTAAQVSAQAYTTMYQMYINGGGNYSQPRQTRIGVSFNF